MDACSDFPPVIEATPLYEGVCPSVLLRKLAFSATPLTYRMCFPCLASLVHPCPGMQSQSLKKNYLWTLVPLTSCYLDFGGKNVRLTALFF